MSNYDICVISAPGDASTADRLADSLRRYRPPKAAVGEDYCRQIVTDTSGSAVSTDASGSRAASRALPSAKLASRSARRRACAWASARADSLPEYAVRMAESAQPF